MGLMEDTTHEGLHDRWTGELGEVYKEGWEGLTAGDSTDSRGFWDFKGNADVDNSNAYAGSLTLHVDGASSSGTGAVSTRYVVSALPTGFAVRPKEITHVYYETTNSTGHNHVLVGPDGTIIGGGGSNNPEVSLVDANGVSDIHTPSTSYQEYRRVTCTFDWDARTFDFLWEDLTGGDADQTATGRPMGECVPFEARAIDVRESGSGGGIDVWLDQITGITHSGSP